MFTGIVQTTVRVTAVEKFPTFVRYRLHFPTPYLENLAIGASICVHGVCQTVTQINHHEVTFEAIEETLKRTTLSDLAVGDWVNIERAAKFGDEIGGHLLSGHVRGKVPLLKRESHATLLCCLTFGCPVNWMKYILTKGFIALNGVSLTVAEITPEGQAQGQFSVHLIPETLRLTTFNQMQAGEWVNVEIDHQTQAIVETVERVLAAKGK